MRNQSVDRTWTVCDCKWMCVEGALCVILSFERLKKIRRTTVRRCALFMCRRAQFFASSMRGYARDMCRPSVLMHRNWFETAHVPCTSTDAPSSYYALTAHVSRSSRNESACTWNVREACVFGRAPSVIHASGVRRMLVEYCTVFACMRQRARYFSDSSVNCK